MCRAERPVDCFIIPSPYGVLLSGTSVGKEFMRHAAVAIHETQVCLGFDIKSLGDETRVRESHSGRAVCCMHQSGEGASFFQSTN